MKVAYSGHSLGLRLQEALHLQVSDIDITFTVPRKLRRFIRAHPRACYRALFEAAAATLQELAKNPKYIGSSRLGFTGLLHTWGRTLSYHPHLHFIVPAGAISEDGEQWLPSRVDFFVPVQAASIIYTEYLTARISTDELSGPGGLRSAVGCLRNEDG